jgi:membrane protein
MHESYRTLMLGASQKGFSFTLLYARSWAMLKRLKEIWGVFYRAGDQLVDHDGIELAGYLTFLSLLSLFPFLVILVALAGFIGQGELGAEFVSILRFYLPSDVMAGILPRIDEITSGPPQALLTVSILAALWTASAAVEGMRTVLNRAYGVNDTPHYVWRRLMAILQLIVITLLIIVTMAALVFAPIIGARFEQLSGITVPVNYSEFLEGELIYLGGALILAGVAFLYYWLPNIRQSLLSTLPGAALVVVLWILGAAGITYYLENISQVNLIYGSLSSFIATLLFFYVMNVIFIYGAEFNHQLKLYLGVRIVEREKS